MKIDKFIDNLNKEWFMNKISEIDEKTTLCVSCKKKLIDGYYE